MPGVLNIWGVGGEKWQGDGASKHLVNRAARAGEIVDEIGQSGKSAAWPNDNFASVVDGAYVANGEKRHVGTDFERVAADGVAEGILELIRLVTAALRESGRKSERGCLPGRTKQIRDLDCGRIHNGVRGRLRSGTKFKIKLAIGKAQLVHRVR